MDRLPTVQSDVLHDGALGALGTLADAIAHMVWSTDEHGRHDYANARWTEYTGQLPEAEFGGPWLELIHPDDRVETQRAWDSALRSGEPYEVEFRLRRHDGVYRWHLSRGVPQRDPHGRIVRWFGTATDIQELRQAHEALRESEQRFRDIAENIREVFWLTDAEQNIMYVSPAYEQLWGRSCAAAYTTPGDFIEGIHPEDRPRVLEQLARRSEGFDIEYRVLRPDGTIRWIHDRAFPVRDESGHASRVAGIAEDVTLRHELETGLLMQAHLLATVEQAIISTDPDGRVISWNRHAETMYGWTAEEAVGRDLKDLVFTVDEASEAETILAQLRAGGKFAMERQVRRKDGSPLWIALTAAPLHDEAGRTIQIVGTSSDITERRTLESQFLQSQKMEAIGRLAGAVAHDFNNLLTVIKAHTEFLAEALPVEGEIGQDVEEIGKAAKRAASLTHQLLAFSRQQLLEKRVVDPNAIVSNLQKMLTRLIGADVELVVELGTGVPRVLADGGQVEQSVMNLVVNARDAMPSGGTLCVQTRRATVSPDFAKRHDDAKPGIYAAILVSDSGSGMPPEVKARMFEPFFTTKGPGQGTGLGLATVYGIVKQSGGFMHVESTVGEGSTFTVYLPETEAAEAVGHPADVDASTAGGHETILVVEDQDEVRAIARRILAKHGYQVVEAPDASQALELLVRQSLPVDLLLTDAVMSGMSGPELIRQIRPVRPDLPVVLMSGYTDDELVRHGGVSVEATFLQKPFTQARLLQAVQTALVEQRRRGA